mmetsp:Transcript_52159/g.151860  ORF Transcript_52159/g.151860 Transcript_52159/m.151860 type:complete len:86 (+) Transcript_52159:1184-1441(+)
MELVFNSKLLCLRKRLKTADGSTNGKSKVKRAKLSTFINKGVNMFLDTKVLVKGSGSLHNSKKIVVTSKEDVKSHFNMVSILVFP